MAVSIVEVVECLRAALGSELLESCPGLPYDCAALMRRYRHTDDTLIRILDALDALIFKAVFAATQKGMRLKLDDGRVIRITQEQIHALADRLLALRYRRLAPDSVLRDDLFDLSRANSYAAMRDLVERFPMDEDDREFMRRVLAENEETDT